MMSRAPKFRRHNGCASDLLRDYTGKKYALHYMTCRDGENRERKWSIPTGWDNEAHPIILKTAKGKYCRVISDMTVLCIASDVMVDLLGCTPCCWLCRPSLVDHRIQRCSIRRCSDLRSTNASRGGCFTCRPTAAESHLAAGRRRIPSRGGTGAQTQWCH